MYPARRSSHLKSGFTLVELLVVVAIIAILSIIGFAIFTDNLKKARDATRRSDIDAIGSALEAHYKVGGANPYLPPEPGWFSSGSIPQDPQGVSLGYYWNGTISSTGFTSASATYVVCAKLEKNNGNSSTPGNSSGTFTNASGDDAGYYCRRSLQ